VQGLRNDRKKARSNANMRFANTDLNGKKGLNVNNERKVRRMHKTPAINAKEAKSFVLNGNLSAVKHVKCF
jgi:hypothetical protein